MDDNIEREVAELLKETPIPLDREQIVAFVEEGVVTVLGTVEARIDAETLVAEIEHLEGVSAVDNQLDWIVDTHVPEQRFPGYPQEGAETLVDH